MSRFLVNLITDLNVYCKKEFLRNRMKIFPLAYIQEDLQDLAFEKIITKKTCPKRMVNIS